MVRRPLRSTRYVLASQSSFKVVPLDLQGQIQGQTTGNALAPKLTVRLRRKWSQTIPLNELCEARTLDGESFETTFGAIGLLV